MVEKIIVREDRLCSEEMAATDDIFCDICNGQHITKPAGHWCPECEEALCSECLTHHSISKYTRNHDVISVDNYKKLPATISKISNRCNEHNKQYQVYCPYHEILCCGNCIVTSHQECTGLKAIDELLKMSKNSVSIHEIQEAVNHIKKNIQLAVDDRKLNLKKVQEERLRFSEEVKSMRVKMNAHLNQMEENVITKLEDSENEIKSQIEKLLSVLSEKMKAVEILEGNVSAIKNYATDLQSFLGIQTLKTEIEKHKESISAFAGDGSMQQIHLKYKADDIVSSVLSSKTFWTVSVAKTSSSVILRTEKEKQAQIMSLVQRQPKQIDELSLHLLLKINLAEIRDVTVYGCTVSPNGNMIFVNEHKKELIVLNENGKLVKSINCTDCTYGVACISNESVAVTKEYSVEVINTDTEKIDKCFKLFSFPDGVVYFETILMWSLKGVGIQRVDLEKGVVITVVENKGMPSYTYLTTDGKHFYYTRKDTSVVTCYKMNGEKIWEFKDYSKLKTPYGITIDNDSNTYIASYDTNSVVVLSHDGKFNRRLLCSDDGIIKPRGIYYDKNRNHLLTANEKGTIFLYDVS